MTINGGFFTSNLFYKEKEQKKSIKTYSDQIKNNDNNNKIKLINNWNNYKIKIIKCKPKNFQQPNKNKVAHVLGTIHRERYKHVVLCVTFSVKGLRWVCFVLG